METFKTTEKDYKIPITHHRFQWVIVENSVNGNSVYIARDRLQLLCEQSQIFWNLGQTDAKRKCWKAVKAEGKEWKDFLGLRSRGRQSEPAAIRVRWESHTPSPDQVLVDLEKEIAWAVEEQLRERRQHRVSVSIDPQMVMCYTRQDGQPRMREVRLSIVLPQSVELVSFLQKIQQEVRGYCERRTPQSEASVIARIRRRLKVD